HSYSPHIPLHPFPTRRSSDLILVPQLSRRVLIGRQTRRNNCHNTSTSTSPLDSLDSFDGLRPNFTAPKCAQVTAITGVKSTSNERLFHFQAPPLPNGSFTAPARDKSNCGCPKCDNDLSFITASNNPPQACDNSAGPKTQTFILRFSNNGSNNRARSKE